MCLFSSLIVGMNIDKVVLSVWNKWVSMYVQKWDC